MQTAFYHHRGAPLGDPVVARAIEETFDAALSALAELNVEPTPAFESAPTGPCAKHGHEVCEPCAFDRGENALESELSATLGDIFDDYGGEGHSEEPISKALAEVKNA